MRRTAPNTLLQMLAIVMLTCTLIACGGSSEPAGDTADATAPDATPPAAAAPAADTPPAAASSAGPCDLLSADDIATALGTDPSLVGAGTPGLGNSDNPQSCDWEIVHDGLEDTVTLWMRTRTEQTAPNAWSSLLQGFIENGETVRDKTTPHQAADLGGATGGALSDVMATAFTKARIYSWHVDDDTLYRLTIARSFEDSGDELPDPTAAEFEPLVRAVLN